MREKMVEIIVARLKESSQALSNDFNGDKGIPTRYTAIDELLPQALVEKIFQSFPAPDSMRLMSSFREKKFTTKSLEKSDPILSDITFALQDPLVIAEVEKITGIRDLKGDPHLYAGGLSLMQNGHFLNPHIDNSHDSKREFYRSLNLLYYVSPGWGEESGGNLELWDASVKKRVEILSRFNRLVIMETHRHSWHSVNPVRAHANRCCVSNYYFSPQSATGEEYFHVTEFSARPDQKLRRLVSKFDNSMRTWVRKFKKDGFGKKDTYKPLSENMR